jgi:hypothetical protein
LPQARRLKPDWNKEKTVMPVKKKIGPAGPKTKAAPKTTATPKPAAIKTAAAPKAKAVSKIKPAPKKAAARKPAVKKPAVAGTAARKPKAPKAPEVKKTPDAPKPAPAKAALSRYEIQRRIRVAAYYKYVKRGRKHGAHLHDWNDAERDILSRL